MTAFDPKRTLQKLINFTHAPRRGWSRIKEAMEADRIPEHLQIDAALTGDLGNLVDRFCGGAWAALASHWTASFEEIVAEAKRRGLDTFVSLRPVSDGFWLLETETDYVVFYMERGARQDHEEFAELEPAFRHWLDQNLRSRLLPGNGKP